MLIAMTKVLIIPAVIVVLLAGCHPEENPEQLKAVNQSLEYANELLQDANNLVYEEFKQLERDPMTANVGAGWNARVKQIRRYADSIKALIRDIQIELIKQSDNLKKDYVDVTKQLHNADGVGYLLLNRLTTFRDSMPVLVSLDTKNRDYIKSHIYQILQTVPLLSGYGDSLATDQKRNYGRKWLEESFGHCSSLMAMVMLNKLKNDVLTTEKSVIDYCNSNIIVDAVVYDKYSAISFLSSSYVKAGEPVELTVGMGAFTNDLNPRITIDGEEVKINDDAVFVHKFIAKGVPGIHTIKVKVEYTKPDGSTGQVWKILKYIIAKN